jgi:hypothetical protein
MFTELLLPTLRLAPSVTPTDVGIHAFTCENKDVDGGPPLAMTVARRSRWVNDNAGWHKIAQADRCGSLEQPDRLEISSGAVGRPMIHPRHPREGALQILVLP